ncbi:MAG: ribbon-helix-helix protein, CopG family [Deltaproteobacteria bacterium]|nr:ribbon-helix-helix protein, CopG family [Deltaproteobacteria bacterium]
MARARKPAAADFAVPSSSRKAVPEDAARKFERRRARGSAKVEQPSLRRETSGERLSVYLPPELAQELRLKCVKQRRSVSDAVTEAVRQWVKS